MSADRHVQRDGLTFNTTQLKLSGHGRMLHRDYTAHFFRWSFARRLIQPLKKVLDVGCGQELPLFMLLNKNCAGTHTGDYVGVDLNKIAKKPTRQAFNVVIKDEFNFVQRWEELRPLGPFDYVTSLEVIEHMEPASGARMLVAFRELLAVDGTVLLSTPVFNGKAAENHVHEYTIEELQKTIEAAGLQVTRRFGTFMNVTQLRLVSAEHRQTAEALLAYYDNNAVVCFLAPLYPDLARNNLWVLRRST
jgi:cyclopropane fatty-acyl-phospholipid synthase-like methyltransferase